MFVSKIQPSDYIDPWATAYHERLATLVKGRKRIAYLCEEPNQSTFRYRVYNMIQVLEAADSQVSASYFSRNEWEESQKFVDLVDVLVISRSRYCHKLNSIITEARNKGKKVFFDVDDLVFDPDYVHLVVNTLDQDLNNPDVWDFWFSGFARCGAALRLCDEVITTNTYLAEKIRDYSGKPVSVIPNFLNREQLEISKRIFEEKKSTRFSRNEYIHFGYFSGTPTHNRDFNIISDVLADLFHSNPSIRLYIVGFLNLKGPLAGYKSRTEFLPLQDFLNLQRLVGLVEVNLIPLRDNVFTNCKSELKYFEAAIVGTLSVASPIFTYRNVIRDGENGYIANSLEWEEKLCTVLESLESYPEMAERAFNDAERKYAWYRQIDLVEKTLLG